MKMLLTSAIALVLLAGCAQTMTPAVTGTETALCDVWQDSLPTRSRADTPETRAAIGRSYDVFEAVCRRKAFP